MENIITITDEIGDGGVVTVTDEEVEGVLTSWFGEMYDDDPNIEDCVNRVAAWAEAGRNAAHIRGVGEATSYLGISVEMHIPQPEPEPNYRDVLSREVVERLTRARCDDALSETGGIPGVEVEDARLAYIQATQGRRAMREAHKAMQAAVDGRDPARRELKRRFIDAWERAHAQWVERRELMLSADLLPGRIIEALRTGTGCSREEWAADLGVTSSTARDWETDRRPAPAGACADMWGMWQRWLTEQAADLGIPVDVITDGDAQAVVLVPDTASVHGIRAGLLMLAGRRLTIDPGPEYQCAYQSDPNNIW